MFVTKSGVMNKTRKGPQDKEVTAEDIDRSEDLRDAWMEWDDARQNHTSASEVFSRSAAERAALWGKIKTVAAER